MTTTAEWITAGRARLAYALTPEARMRMTDADRIRGQITRGEIRAGADAAREIAARHQAAYGDAVWGPAPATVPAAADDEAWADALTSLTTTDPKDGVA